MRRIVLLTISLAIASLAYAQTPNTISFQGSLNNSGTTTPVANGNYDMTFELFDDLNNSLWTETQFGVLVTNGLINVQLGSVTALEIDDFYQPLQLEITIESETLTPRIALSAVPFAQTSKAVVGTDSIVFRLANQKAGILDQTNTALGFGSFSSEQGSGFFNEAIGTGALASNNGGSQNVAIGSYALGANTTGNTNIAIGYEALNVSSTSRDNIAIGPFALQNNTDGIENVGVGRDALKDNTTGGLNTAVGSNAMEANISGERNVAVGYNTGSGAVGVPQESGTNNTLIGTDANVGVDGLTNATAIGFGAVVSQNNSMVLGNNSVNVGIGTSTPAEKLSVNGNIASNGTINANSFVYRNAEVRYLSIPAAAMVLSQSTYSQTEFDNDTDGQTNSHNSLKNTQRRFSIGSNFASVGGGDISNAAYMTAPVYLPDGATITDLEALIFETNSTYDVSVHLISTPFGVQNTESIQTTASSTGTPGHTVISSAGLSIPVNNMDNAYYIRFDTRENTSGSIVFYHARITYEVSNPD